MHSKEDEERSPAYGHRALGDSRRHVSPAQDRGTRAHGVTHDTSDGDAVRVARRREADGGYLAAISPFSEERDDERFQKHRRQQPAGSRRDGVAPTPSLLPLRLFHLVISAKTTPEFGLYLGEFRLPRAAVPRDQGVVQGPQAEEKEQSHREIMRHAL